MKRRTFIIGLGAMLVSAVAMLVAGPHRLVYKVKDLIARLAAPSDKKIARMIGQDLNHLMLREEIILQFIKDYERVYKDRITLPVSHRIKVLFLLSTDFVQNGATYEKPLNYVVIYSPYDNPCYNPFMLIDKS
jgi:hypothetical protein